MNPKRVDENQREIVRALRACGCTVQHLHEVGDGCPDILVGFRGRNYLLEIKNPETKGRLTNRQKEWFSTWRGQAAVVRTAEEALEICT
jgi:Holliday junction resolvase